jgi:hypothetical protein
MSSPKEDKMDAEQSTAPNPQSPSSLDGPSLPVPGAATDEIPKSEVDQDADMEDAPSEEVTEQELSVEAPISASRPQADAAEDGSEEVLTVDPPVPPLAPVVESTEPEADGMPVKPTQIDMPPPSANPFAQPVLPNGPSAHSPGSLSTASVFSPAVTAAVSPSPARKKLSLSDYTRRSKAKDKEPDGKVDRESSPASTASGPAATAVIQPSSASEAAAADGGSAIVDDDVKMEDADATTAAVPPPGA